MPTQSTTYNTRLTDESLEKRFRDTFRSQNGAELVDDLYASGVIVPVVDFTAAAEGSALRSDLQSAWDFSTGQAQVNNGTTNLITNAGFWKVDLTCSFDITDGAIINRARIEIFDGSTAKQVWAVSTAAVPTGDHGAVSDGDFVVFLRSGDTLRAVSTGASTTVDVWYRQIADVYGNLQQPSGYTSS